MSDIAYRNVAAAFEGIADGRQIDQFVTPHSFGKQVRIFEALKAGIKLDGTFGADHLNWVDIAFARTGHKRPSDNISECANAMLTTLVPKK